MSAEMSPGVQALFDAAAAAQAQAYVPYSRFKVGAAIRSGDGRVFAGCNIENAAYPIGNCAEASAIAHMVMAGGRAIAEVLVIGDGDGLCTPCGGCRQRLREFASDDVVVHIAGAEGVRGRFTLGELLPASFGPANLGL